MAGSWHTLTPPASDLLWEMMTCVCGSFLISTLGVLWGKESLEMYTLHVKSEASSSWPSRYSFAEKTHSNYPSHGMTEHSLTATLFAVIAGTLQAAAGEGSS